MYGYQVEASVGGCVGECIDRWLGACEGGWIDGWIDGCMGALVYQWSGGQACMQAPNKGGFFFTKGGFYFQIKWVWLTYVPCL